MTREQRETLFEALQILVELANEEQAERERLGIRRDVQTDFDRAAVALSDSLQV